jgi:hypothetical protein
VKKRTLSVLAVAAALSRLALAGGGQTANPAEVSLPEGAGKAA